MDVLSIVTIEQQNDKTLRQRCVTTYPISILSSFKLRISISVEVPTKTQLTSLALVANEMLFMRQSFRKTPQKKKKSGNVPFHEHLLLFPLLLTFPRMVMQIWK